MCAPRRLTAGAASPTGNRMARLSESAPPDLDLGKLGDGIRAGDRALIARAITLVESKRTDHRKAAHRLVQELLPQTGKAARIGITGAPGVGKSLTIDTFGTYLTGTG